jgi:hypothetical protein
MTSGFWLLRRRKHWRFRIARIRIPARFPSRFCRRVCTHVGMQGIAYGLRSEWDYDSNRRMICEFAMDRSACLRLKVA